MPDSLNIPSWSEFQAARQRFFDGLAADSTRRRLDVASRTAGPSLEPQESSSRTSRSEGPLAHWADGRIS
jgi:hypothetical protein